MADEFYVDDLTNLWRTGAVLMPQVGAQFVLAATALHRTGLDESMFQTSHGPSPLAGPWTLLRDTVQGRVLAMTAERCVNAGEALVRIADGYATTDHYNAADLRIYAADKAEIRSDANATFQIPDVPTLPTHPQQDG